MSTPVKELHAPQIEHVQPNNQLWLKTSSVNGLTDTHSRKLLRLLRHLRDDLQRNDAVTPMPSAWLLRCVIRCNPGYTRITTNWLSDMQNFLKSVTQQTDSEKMGLLQFYDITQNHALFPNSEEFSLEDLSHFCRYALRYLRNLDGNTEVN